MSVYHQIFQIMDQPMLLMRSNRCGVQIEDANSAFLRLTGYTLEEVKSVPSEHLIHKYKADTSKHVVKSEFMMFTKQKRQIAVRIDQQPLPKLENDDSQRSLIIFEDLTSYKWIEQQAELSKVLISGIIDRHFHIRFLRDRLASLLFEPDRKMDDESLLDFIADTEHGRLKAILEEAYVSKKGRSLTLKTSKLSGIELELSLSFTPIVDGFEMTKEIAFVIWDLKPVDDKIDASIKLKIWMAKRDVTAGQLSASTGISIQTISKLRNGKIEKPQRLTAELIASELQVDIHEIWTDVRK